MDTIKDLLTTIERLPAPDRSAAVAEIERILELAPPARALALGLLALDLAPHALDAAAAATGEPRARELVA